MRVWSELEFPVDFNQKVLDSIYNYFNFWQMRGFFRNAAALFSPAI